MLIYHHKKRFQTVKYYIARLRLLKKKRRKQHKHLEILLKISAMF